MCRWMGSLRWAVSCIKFIGKVRPGNPLYALIHNRVVPISTSVKPDKILFIQLENSFIKRGIISNVFSIGSYKGLDSELLLQYKSSIRATAKEVL